MRSPRKTTKRAKRADSAPAVNGTLGPTRAQAKITGFMQALSERHSLPAESSGMDVSPRREGRPTLSSGRLAARGRNSSEDTALPLATAQSSGMLAEPQIMAEPTLSRPTSSSMPIVPEMPHESGPKLTASIADRWSEPLNTAPHLPAPTPVLSQRMTSEAAIRPGSVETSSLSRPAIPAASWLGVAPPAPEPPLAEIVPMAALTEGDGDANLPRLTGPIPMPAPMSPLAAHSGADALREEALQPTAAQALLRRPEAVALMALPYAPSEAQPTGEKRADTRKETASSPGAQDISVVGAPAPGALARFPKSEPDKDALRMQESMNDVQGEAEPARIALPDAVLARPIEPRSEKARRDGGAHAIEREADARFAEASMKTASEQVFFRSPSSLPKDDAMRQSADERAPVMERARSYRTREASPGPAPMPLARTALPASPAARGQAANNGDAAYQSESRFDKANDIIHRQVIVQRAETGESAAGGAEGDAGQGQAGGRNAEQEHGKQGDEGAASGDINLLANEVYGLIKRRLAQEAERMGRSR